MCTEKSSCSLKSICSQANLLKGSSKLQEKHTPVALFTLTSEHHKCTRFSQSHSVLPGLA